LFNSTEELFITQEHISEVDMCNVEYYCQSCSSLLSETIYFGITIYECPICAQLHDEFGDITDEDQLKQFFINKENNLDELYPHRKMDDNEGYTEEVVNEDQKERYNALIQLGKVNKVIESYIYESNKVTKDLIFEILSDWAYNLEIDKRFKFISDIENHDLKYELLDNYDSWYGNAPDFYMKFLDDGDERIRITAIECLSSYCEPYVLKVLRKVLKNEKKTKVIRALEEAIEAIKFERSNKKKKENFETSNKSETSRY
jgi:hypothetical protein